MEKLRVIKVTGEDITFDNGYQLHSDHYQDCCENHYLDFSDLSLDDFENLTFDLSGDDFFNRVEDYGIELIPIKGLVVRVPGYGFNNGYYGSNIDLVIADDKGNKIKSYDVSECQLYNEY